MKLKLDENGHVVLDDGKPVYVYEDGKELPYDAVHSAAKIKELNGEAKKHREAKEAAEASLKAFEGLDPEAARKAFETIKNLDDKKLIDAGQVDKVKQEAKAAFEEQLRAVEGRWKPVEAERDSLKAELDSQILNVAFGESSYIKDKVQSPLSLIRAGFGQNFTIENRKPVARDASGNPIYSRSRPGELAEFNEAIAILIEGHPDRDAMLKGTGASGVGSGGYRTDASGKRTVSRAEFEKMDPVKQRETALSGADIAD